MAGRRIDKGEMAMVPDWCIANPEPVTVKEEAPPDPDAHLKELLRSNSAAIIAALPELDLEALKKLEALEGAAKQPRKGVLGALAELCLARVAKTLEEGGGDGTGEGGTDAPKATTTTSTDNPDAGQA